MTTLIQDDPSKLNHDYTHPEHHLQGLTFVSDDEYSKELIAERKGLLDLGHGRKEVQLCWACGWSAYQQINTSYSPRVKIFHTRSNIGVWAIGTDWLLKDQPNDSSLGNDYMTQEFLKQQPGVNIPLVQQIRLSKPTDPIQFTLMSRAQGDTLYSIWNTLSPEQKSNYRKQLADCIRQLRQFTAPTAMKVDGSQLDDVMIGFCTRRHPPTCKKMGSNNDEWFENIKEELRHGLYLIHKTKDPTIIDAKLQELRDSLPDSEPYVLTHADLNLTNIIVKDDKIQAIIDWEMSGYYPWWAERWLSLKSNDDETGEFFDHFWAEFDPAGMDDATFVEQIALKTVPLSQAYARCLKKHPERDAAWLRPGFCECKPYAGKIKWTDLGNSMGHEIREPGVTKKGTEALAILMRSLAEV